MKKHWLKRMAALAMSFLMAATMISEAVFAENAGSVQPSSVHVYESTPGDVASDKYTLQADMWISQDLLLTAGHQKCR